MQVYHQNIRRFNCLSRSQYIVNNESGRRVACRAVSETDPAALSCVTQVWQAAQPSRMILDDRAFVEEYRIRGYEVGPNGETSILTIANLMQEVASNHVVSLWGRSSEGFATDPEMAKDGLIFVMTRMQIQMDAYPRWGDVIVFETWFQYAGKMRAYRDWVIKDSDGVVIGRATSTWVTINMKTRRLGKVGGNTRDRLLRFQYSDSKAFPDDRTQLKLPELVSHEEVEVKFPQVARSSDMDLNGHINNVTYINWLLETVPSDVQSSKKLHQIEIDYKNECTSGDLIHPLAEVCETPDVFLQAAPPGHEVVSYVHSLERGDESNTMTELVRARTMWV